MSSEAEWAKALAFAESLEPALRRAVLAALATAQSAVDLGTLVGFLERGDVAGATAYCLAGFHTAPLSEAALLALRGAQRYAVGAADPAFQGALAHVAFDGLNPAVLDALKAAKLRYLGVTKDAQEGVRTALLSGFRRQQPPAALARALREWLGLPPNLMTAVANYRAALETGHVSALQRALRDRRFDATVASGKPLDPAYVDKLVTAYARRALAHHATTIARTEALNALHAGQRTAFAGAFAQGVLREDAIVRRWYVAHDERVCPVCAPIPGLNPDGRGWSEPFVLPKGLRVLGPTAHFQCRCYVFSRPRPGSPLT